MSELAAAYEALCAGRVGPDLPPLLIQYADFAAWQRARLDGGMLEAQVCVDLRGRRESDSLVMQWKRSCQMLA